MAVDFPKQQKLHQKSDRDCSVPVFACLAGISDDELLSELPQAALGEVSVDQWKAWLEQRGFQVRERVGCPCDVVPCAHLVAEHPPRDKRDFHWIYRDEDGDVHDPSPVFTAMPADDPRMRSLSLYPHLQLTLSVSRLSMLERLNTLAQPINAFATVILAIVTVALVCVTYGYVGLTNKLLQEQQEPQVGLAFSASANSLTIEDSGSQPVVDVNLWYAAYLHDVYGRPIPPLSYVQYDWWRIPTLAVGVPESKSILGAMKSTGHMIDIGISGFKKANPHARFSPQTHLVFFVQYRRKVDHKLYESHLDATLLKDSNTGKYFVMPRPVVLPEPDAR